MKTVQVIEDAAQKKKHRAIRPEPIDAQFDIIQNIYIPEPQVNIIIENYYFIRLYRTEITWKIWVAVELRDK